MREILTVLFVSTASLATADNFVAMLEPMKHPCPKQKPNETTLTRGSPRWHWHHHWRSILR